MTSAHDLAFTETLYQLAQQQADHAAQSLVEPFPDGGPAHHQQLAAAQHLLRACALLRVARFPFATTKTTRTSSPSQDQKTTSSSADADARALLQEAAHTLQNTLYVRAMRLWDAAVDNHLAPLEEVRVPHVHDLATHPDAVRPYGGYGMGLRPAGGMRQTSQSQGPRRPHIPMYVRVPLDTLLTGQPCPALLILTADRTGETARCREALARGWAAVVVEEVPHEDDDAQARMWSSVLDWMRGMYFYDMDRVVAVGSGSTAVRLAHSHGSRLQGVVAHVRDGEVVDRSAVGCPLLIVQEETEPAATHFTTNRRHHKSSSSLSSLPHQKQQHPEESWTNTKTAMDIDTPEKQQEEEEDDQHSKRVKLSEYRPEKKGCVGQLRTLDTSKVFGWMDDVMVSRETHIKEQPTSCREQWLCYSAGVRQTWWTDQWKPPSPPNCEAEKKSLWLPVN